MEGRIVAYYGLVCTDCDAYKATQAEDRDEPERMAKQASEQFGIEMTIDDAMCDGCLASSGRQIGYCTQCEIRACRIDRLVDNCTHCEDYACARMDSFAKQGTAHRATLDAIRDRLGDAG